MHRILLKRERRLVTKGHRVRGLRAGCCLTEPQDKRRGREDGDRLQHLGDKKFNQDLAAQPRSRFRTRLHHFTRLTLSPASSEVMQSDEVSWREKLFPVGFFLPGPRRQICRLLPVPQATGFRGDVLRRSLTLRRVGYVAVLSLPLSFE